MLLKKYVAGTVYLDTIANRKLIAMITGLVRSSGREEALGRLQQEILAMQGNAPAAAEKRLQTGLGPAESAFPSRVFPVGVVHEFLSTGPGAAAATNGFIAGLLRAFRTTPGPCIWVSTGRTLFPPALAAFGVAPERVLFVDVSQAREALWAIEEALQCSAVAVVVGELSDLSFTESRRLQLAVEESRVTALIHRTRPRTTITAAVARWQITALPSAPEDGLPGLGYPRWSVRLLKVRNGRPGSWPLELRPEGFCDLSSQALPVAVSAGWGATG